MKKFLTILVFTVVCSAASATEIDPKSPIGMGVMKTGSVLKVYYRGSKPGDVKITITDRLGKMIYKETIKSVDNFMRPYNLLNIGEGEYTIEVDGENGKQRQTVNYQKENKTQRLLSLVRLAGSDNRYVLSIANKQADRLHIKIFTGNHSLLYNEVENISGDFAKLYNLDDINEAFYFEITGKDGISQIVSYPNR